MGGRLLAIALPAWVAGQLTSQPLGALDAVAAVLVVLFIAGETMIDEQWSL